MNNYPEFVKVNGKLYKINTDFRYALRCEEIAQDETIKDVERALAIIFTLYGDEGLSNGDDYAELLEKAIIYLQCGKEVKPKNGKPDCDVLQDYCLIEPSFKSDYGIDLEHEEMHWYKFSKLMNGLTDKCVLNRVREIRTYDLSTIKDSKTKNKIREMQKEWALKERKKPITDKQRKAHNEFFVRAGLRKE